MRPFIATVTALALSTLPVFADTPTVVSALPTEVNSASIVLTAHQPSLFDDSQHDTFTVNIVDQSGVTDMTIECSASQRHIRGKRADESCGVSGLHSIRNPNDPTHVIPRADIYGDLLYKEHSNRGSGLRAVRVNYHQLGGAAAKLDQFSGTLSPTQIDFTARQKYIAPLLLGDHVSTVDQPVMDGALLSRVVIPHIGQQDSKSCMWGGEFTFAAPVKRGWAELEVFCAKVRYHLVGYLYLTDSPADSIQNQEYVIRLELQQDNVSGDPFAPAPAFQGLAGNFYVEHGGGLTDYGVFEDTEMRGVLSGTGVPLELTRGFAQLLNLLGRTILYNNPQPIPPS